MKKSLSGKKPHKAGMLTSILIIVMSALVVSISLTVILFSLLGKVVYGQVIANSMRPQARVLADASAELLTGALTEDSFKFMMRSSETTLVILNEKGELAAFSEPRMDSGSGPSLPQPVGSEQPEGGSPGEGGRPPEPDQKDGKKNGDRLRTYVEHCRSVLDKAVDAAPYSEYTEYPQSLGVIVALPVTDESGAVLGAVFLIKPVNDIAETSKSVMIVLVMASLAVALLMILPIYFISRWLSDPVKKLNSAAAGFANGDMTSRVVPDGPREIGLLGESFNELADNLERNISDLTLERNRLRAVLDGLSEGLIAFDTQGRVVNWNSSAALLLGGEPNNDPSQLPAFGDVRAAVDTVFETGASCIDATKSGERVIRISAAPVYREHGQSEGAIVLLMDMTEAERLEQTRRDYVANVSHELRTPLASIRGIADMLNDGLVKNDDDKRRYYGYILKESIRLSTLINDLLELSRLQSGGVEPEVRKAELYELVADVAYRTEDRASERGMSIRMDVPEGRYFALTNPDRVEQVLISLFDNAVKHGSEGGYIRVSIGEQDDKWLVSVENPADVRESDLDHIFERFYKADVAHSGEGTGLGLAIAEEILRVMGESIRVNYEQGVIKFTFTVSKFEK